MNLLRRYTHWLHTQWPAGTVEQLPIVNDDGSTNVPGLFIVGDLTGVPLLKFAADSGARSVQAIAQQASFNHRDTSDSDVFDLAIVGGGVSGFAAALEAKKRKLSFRLIEATEAFSTIDNFPKAKPIYTYPTEMTPAGDLQFHDNSNVKEGLLDDLREQTLEAGIEPVYARVEYVERRGAIFHVHAEGEDDEIIKAHRVIVAIGRSGNFHTLDVPGEHLDKVYNRLHDPFVFDSQNVLVVGGGDSAMETAMALATGGANVTLSYRQPEFSRPKPENIEKVRALAQNPDQMIGVESVTGDRVTTPSGSFMQPKHGGRLRLMMSSNVSVIHEGDVVVTDADGQDRTIENDAVFLMIGREAPLEFLRRIGVRIAGDRGWPWWLSFAFVLALFTFIYHWKNTGVWLPIAERFQRNGWFPYNMPEWWSAIGEVFNNPSHILGVMKISVGEAGFYYSVAYCLLMLIFGFRRVRRRKTPYVCVQTFTLVAVQIVPLFLLPYFLLPWLGNNGVFGNQQQIMYLDRAQNSQWMSAMESLRAGSSDAAATIELLVIPAGESTSRALADVKAEWPGLVAHTEGGQRVVFNPETSSLYLTDPTESASIVGDALFPHADYGHGREYWRAFGFVLAWPLFVWNVFTDEPMWTWLIISFVQTFVIIPLIIRRWGKGAYCGWVCSCGGMAETLGDAHRHKMPHGPMWNRMNMIGQAFLAVCLLLLVMRFISWVWPGSIVGSAYQALLKGIPVFNYTWFIDLLFAGIIGFGMYFHLSGRVWCRFACPLAALMHMYARFSRFRIFADKKRCISCNVCTSVCHQGIDVMNFANKGIGMNDPECVRCSACVQSCPTGVLTFGRIGSDGQAIHDRLSASPVQRAELTINGASRR